MRKKCHEIKLVINHNQIVVAENVINVELNFSNYTTKSDVKKQ